MPPAGPSEKPPVSTAPGAPPAKIGKESTKGKGGAKFLTIVGLGFAGLFIAFIVLMVLVIGKGGDKSPILRLLA